jgi:hypothetical protein
VSIAAANETVDAALEQEVRGLRELLDEVNRT